MKRKLMGLLCACILLSGCRSGSDPTVQTQPPVLETTVATVPTISLLEQGETLAESPNLMYIPNETIEGMVSPWLRLLGNGLLVSDYCNQRLRLNHISLEDGSLIASFAIEAGVETRIAIGNGEIGLSDRESGVVTILDESLRTLRTYPVTAGGEEWYLNAELDTLYIFFADRGVMAYELETGAERWLVENGFQVTATDSGNGYVYFTYTDRADQKTYDRCLDLASATMETLPLKGDCTRQGEIWLIQKIDEAVLVLGEDPFAVGWTDSPVRLLSPRRHLLVTDASQRTLMFHDTEGNFLSRCDLPQGSHAMMGEDLVWSGYWDGYFFTDFLGEYSRLMFWDVNAETEGEALALNPLGMEQPTETLLEPALYDRAKEISERYGVEVYLADQCELIYTHYESFALTDPVYVSGALDVLEKALSRYPEGFFGQLCYGSVETIRFEVVGSLYVRDGVTDRRNSVAAFAQNRGSYYSIVVAGFTPREDTIYHEISHIIDKKLAWDAQIRPDALYSEEGWMALQPDGFRFIDSYVETPDYVADYLDTGYFIEEYGMTFPTEDRAVLMETAMMLESRYFEPGSGLRAKLQYYADCIRDCFDTEGWPEVLPWEQVL
ncbi:MAG: hypothetical protein IKU31_02525 [Oscillospiraceae bacterium]|nr:hypothetical protein [Oscillospiraceae bacterium]